MNVNNLEDKFSSGFRNLKEQINKIKWIMTAACSGMFSLLLISYHCYN